MSRKLLLLAVVLFPSQFAIAQDETLETPLPNLSAAEAATYFQEIGELESAQELRRAIEIQGENTEFSKTVWPWGGKIAAYQHANHAYGFIPLTPANSTGGKVAINAAGNIAHDATLKGKQIVVTLDRLRIFDYPGKGNHQVLFEFEGRHQAAGSGENLKFNQTYRATEGTGAGIIGYPVFVGLQVSDLGVQFRGRTVNVKNEDDEEAAQFLDSPTFKSGLMLATAANPLSPVVTEFASGLVKSFLKRNENKIVQEFAMGLDFSTTPTGARLREGSYVVVQSPDIVWDWTKWEFDPATGQVVSKEDGTQTIPLNYLVFSVRRMN